MRLANSVDDVYPEVQFISSDIWLDNDQDKLTSTGRTKNTLKKPVGSSWAYKKQWLENKKAKVKNK